MDLQFKRAVKRNLYARIALLGPTGSGKTYTATRWAYALADSGKIAAIDTEHGSLSKYAGMRIDGQEWRPDVIEFDSFSPEHYIDAIHLAEKLGYEVLIIDSLSHAWAGKDGTLEYVDKVAQRDGGGGFQAWRKGTSLQNELVETILGAKLHIIATMRVKMDYVVEKDSNGKTSVRKVGLQPVQRDGVEYEFDLVCDLNADNVLTVSKTRCPELNEKSYRKPGIEPIAILRVWLNGDKEATPRGQDENGLKPAAVAGDWVNNARYVKAFHKFLDELGLTNEQALEALGVDALGDYKGSTTDAKAAVNAYIAAQIARTEQEG